MRGHADAADPGAGDRIQRCAEALLAAWTTPASMAAVIAAAAPRNVTEAQAVADLVVDRCGLSPAGWKIAGTDPVARAHLDLDGRFSGRLFAERLLTSPANVPPGKDPVVLEVELGVRIVPGEVGGPEWLVAAVAPCLEVPAIHIADLAGRGLLLIADNGGGSGAVVGSEAGPAALGDDGTAPVTVRVESADGSVATRDGTASLARAQAAVTWLAGAAPAGLASGEVVLTGALTGVHLLSPGDMLTADFGGALGAVSIAVEGP